MLKIRPLTAEDKPMVIDWIERDILHHKIGIKWEHAIAPGTHAVVMSDEFDMPLEIVRYHTALRVGVQFNPDAGYRIARHGKEFIEELKTHARDLKAKEIIVAPGGKSVRFADWLGFEDFSGSKRLGV